MSNVSNPTKPNQGQGQGGQQRPGQHSGNSGQHGGTATMDKAKDDGPDFIGLARAARARKFGPDIPKDWKERSRQARFLQYRGFSTDHIRAVLEGSPDDLESDSPTSGEPDLN